MASKTILYQGKSGSGKSFSYLRCDELGIAGLPPEKTILLNLLGKELPTKGAERIYTGLTKENPNGNMLITQDPDMIIKIIEKVNKDKSNVENIVIDDAQSLFALEVFRRASEKGYDKWNIIGERGFRFYLWLIDNKSKLRDNLYIWILTHTDEYEMQNSGLMVIKTKTAGQMVDNYCSLEGLFTCVLHGVKKRDKMTKKIEYFIKTKPEYEQDVTKTPYGMFKEQYIPNDLGAVRAEMENYYNN